MRWRRARRSENVEDRRHARGGGRALKLGGIGGLIAIIAALVLGIDPSFLLGLQGHDTGVRAESRAESTPPQNDEMAQFVRAVLGDTEDTWRELFAANGRAYREPKLVLFRGSVRSACGFAQSATGPFYCPADQQVYIDLAFYETLRKRLGAPGDFAQAYVIAHEVGHHVQNLLGTSRRVQSQRGRVSQERYNALSVRLELQADYYAGVWAHHARKRGLIEPGDIEEALNAAAAIGDDRLQRRSRGYVVPESFTHGTSEQRARWFKRGLESGDMSGGDTFAARDL